MSDVMNLPMSRWMRISSFILFFSFISFSALACELKHELVSLSSPVTTVLEELNLLNSKKLMAISKLYNSKTKFRGQLLGGGIFLAKKTVQKFQDISIFYDRSLELELALTKSGAKKLIEIDTRAINPFSAYEKVKQALAAHLSKCQKQLQQLDAKVSQIKRSIAKKKTQKIIFYLGNCVDKKRPQMVIVQDGFVKYLVDQNIIKTYPGPLGYVTWSAREMNKLKGFKHFCVHSEDVSKFEFKSRSLGDDFYEIRFGDAFIPGLSQIYFLEKLTKLL
jgi:hypothetical protein